VSLIVDRDGAKPSEKAVRLNHIEASIRRGCGADAEKRTDFGYRHPAAAHRLFEKRAEVLVVNRLHGDVFVNHANVIRNHHADTDTRLDTKIVQVAIRRGTH
jgi:hypothetical protein